MRKTALSLVTAGLIALINSGCASDGSTNWGAALLEIGGAAAQIHGATAKNITPQQRVNSMVVGNSLHNLAVMQNNMEAAKAGKTTVVVNQPQPTQVYAPAQNSPRYEAPRRYESKQKEESQDPIVRNLEKLLELKNAGIFTEEEYQIKRKSIIENAYK